MKKTPQLFFGLCVLLVGFVGLLPVGCGGKPQGETQSEASPDAGGGPDTATSPDTSAGSDTSANIDAGVSPDVSATPDVVTKPDTGTPTDTTGKPDASGGGLSYAKDIAPLIQKKNCANGYCHGSGKGGLTLGDGYAAFVNKKSTSGKWTRVLPGDPEKSLLYNKISQETPAEGGRMPPGGSYTEAELKLFRDWILQGAKP